MTDVLLDYAEEKFLANEIQEACDLALLAQTLDPYFVNLDRYVAAYQIHAAALKTNRHGEPDWYEVLDILNCWLPDEVIARQFCRLAKLVDPDSHSSAAAKGAYQLISRAFEVLGDSRSRIEFHRRWKWSPPKYTAANSQRRSK